MSAINASFDLVDDSGRPVTEQSYRGAWLMVYFGFTHCRVVCPRSLTKLSSVLDALPDRLLQNIQPLYVSVDPQRDTPEVMRQYLADKHPRFTGLTGTEDRVAEAKAGFRVFSRPKPNPEDPDGYDMPHSAITYLIDPEGAYVTHWAEIRSAEEIEQDIRSRLSA